MADFVIFSYKVCNSLCRENRGNLRHCELYSGVIGFVSNRGWMASE